MRGLIHQNTKCADYSKCQIASMTKFVQINPFLITFRVLGSHICNHNFKIKISRKASNILALFNVGSQRSAVEFTEKFSLKNNVTASIVYELLRLSTYF